MIDQRYLAKLSTAKYGTPILPYKTLVVVICFKCPHLYYIGLNIGRLHKQIIVILSSTSILYRICVIILKYPTPILYYLSNTRSCLLQVSSLSNNRSHSTSSIVIQIRLYIRLHRQIFLIMSPYSIFNIEFTSSSSNILLLSCIPCQNPVVII